MKKILLIDDESDITMLVSTLLEFYNYKVQTLNDPLQVISTLEKEKFDLVCTDIMMPNLDGIELIKRLRNNKKTESIKIIVLSAKEFTPVEYDFLTKNQVLLIKKPYEPTGLVHKIAQQLQA